MAGDIETWGSGFEKFKLACSRYGAPLPEIKATKGNITIRISPADSYLKVLNRSYTAAESAESADYPADMKPRHKQILDAMLKDVWYSAEQIGEKVALKGSRTRELMKELVDLGYVEITADTRGRRYKKK